MTHTPGTVGILTHDLTRDSWAIQSLCQLQVPEGYPRIWVRGNGSAAGGVMVSLVRAEEAWRWLS